MPDRGSGPLLPLAHERAVTGDLKWGVPLSLAG